MCWSGHRDVRDSWTVERRARADVRVSDADRQSTIDELSRHTGDGRLTLEEFEARVDEALQAKTHGELQVALRELPVARRPIRQRYSERRLRAVALWLVVIVAAAVVISPGVLWWLVPLALFKLGAFGHHRGRSDQARELPRGRDDLTLV